MPGEYAIGVDFGGTLVKYVVVTPAGEILRQFTTGGDVSPHLLETTAPLHDAGAGILPPISPSPSLVEAQIHSESLRRVLANLQNEQGRPASTIGLAAPGLTAREGWSIAYMPGRLNWLEGLNWTEALQSPVPVPVLNDSHAALMGEVWQGSARGLSEVILLTLGTGVGGAILSGGRLLKGHIGRAGHLGHLSLNPQGAPDICGTPGSLEDAIGECTLPARSGGRYTSTRELVEDFKRGDSDAAAIWIRSVRALACGIASLINILDPEAVVIGGGVAAAGRLLFVPLEDILSEVEWRPGGHRVRILRAAAGDYAGALGAAYYALGGGSAT